MTQCVGSDGDRAEKDLHDSLIHDWNHIDQQHPQKHISLDDETLRDGLQSPSVMNPRIDQKIELLHLMADLGIDTANIGLPGAGPHVVEHTERLAREIASAKLAIGANCAARTVVADLKPIVEIVQRTGVPIVAATFLGSSPIRRYVEDWDIDRLVRCTEESVTFAVKNGLEVMFVTEDTTRADPATLRTLYAAAIRCGARRLVVCDTVGHATPAGVRALVKFIRGVVAECRAEVKIDWHGHNDRGLALTNALTAIVAGADQVHGCGLGIGERCGNTSMDQLLVNLHLLGWRRGRSLKKLPDYCRLVSKACGVPIPHNYPVVGTDAFETGTGVHAAAVIKAYRKNDPWLANRVYSGVPADEFGLEQKILVGPMSGKSNVIWVLEKLGLPKTDEVVDRVFAAAKRSRRNLTDEEVRSIAEDRQFVDEWSHFAIG
jgi:isopropylmalate/homocitrate/citramalate synthase